MAIIKWKTGDNKWFTFYVEAIRNRLRRDLNLSDLTDKQKARENIELNGDNNHTHFHDDRYLPVIEASVKKNNQEIITSINDEASIRQKTDTELSKQILDVKNQQDAINKNIQSDVSAVSQKINSFTVFDSQGRLVFPNGSLMWIE